MGRNTAGRPAPPGATKYTRPTLQTFGTLRELTLGGSAANYDFGNANNTTCNRSAPNCWVPIPNPRS
jgi:hypothetical protein